jgi:hypothetical protein
VIGCRDISIAVFVVVSLSFMLGAYVAKHTTKSPMYHKDYKECVSKLPRNQDCVAVKIVFKVVESE